MSIKSDQITQKELKKVLRYDPNTGFFTWKVTDRTKLDGECTGTKKPSGYIQIRCNNIYYYAHRLAWLYTYGVHPAGELDHINGVKHDNRITNLRVCTRSENMMNRKLQSNNTTGQAGIYYSKPMDKWCARVKIDGKYKYLGSYPTKEEAGGVADAYRRKEFEAFYTPHEGVDLDANDHFDDLLDGQLKLGSRTFSARRNLRDALKDSKAKYHGVQYCKTSDKWVARCKIGDKRVSLGSFETKEQAQAVADLFKTK